MTAAKGDTVFEGTDVRRYTLGVRDRFVIENVFSEAEDASLTHSGIQLVGLDAKTGNLHISAFWPWQAAILGGVVAKIEKQADGNIGISGVARAAGQQWPKPELNWSCLPEDELRCLTVTNTEGGASSKVTKRSLNAALIDFRCRRKIVEPYVISVDTQALRS